ncbi:hypothetical protein DLAC_02975 [Tieghemostelium lacteum]|uniref:F-box/LRR-repeat protein 15/At3g58940/PEG3-like LRR domain-containing protein n=1 Tax=Tieghemostelium lacteum TaxID=361077 RepID=A0A152A3W1_TIELA|nr:hypothetical protein DLAC_02975 [Tieghemostelium lacteum]|eukprot:KYR00910.1 hypothetical protein DLAC_02975 [Tieghemostelium lacteum]
MTTTLFVKPTILPNLIIKDILEYLLNRIEDDFEYLISFILRYTLISKKWNEEIFRMLKVNNILTTGKFYYIRNGYEMELRINYEMINKWFQLADRYNIAFELDSKVLLDKKKLRGELRDKVVTLTNFTDKFTKSDFNYYKTLKKVVFQSYKLDSKNLLSEFCDNIKYKLYLSCQSGYQEIPENITEIVFNQNLFTRLKIGSLAISALEYHNQLTQLRHFELYSIKISKNALYSILSRSPNLQKLTINGITLLDCTLDTIVKLIADISKFQKLSIVSNDTISLKSVLDLFNRVQCKHVEIRFHNIRYETKEEITSAVIDNTSIEKFRFIPFDVRSHTNNDEKMELDYLSIWKDKSHLKEVEIFREDRCISEMANLEKLDIKFYQGTKSKELEKYIIPTKLPKLEELKILGFEFSTINQILKTNPNITKMTILALEINELVSILDSQQFPTLSDLFIEMVWMGKNICEENVVLSAFQNNTTIRYLKIREYEIEMKKPQSFLMSIIQVNRSYISLIVCFGLNDNFSEDQIDYNLLDEILSNNTTIKKLCLPSTVTLTDYLYSKKLIHIFNKYSVIRGNKIGII